MNTRSVLLLLTAFVLLVSLPAVSAKKVERPTRCEKIAHCSDCSSHWDCLWCYSGGVNKCLNTSFLDEYRCDQGCIGDSCKDVCNKACTKKIFPCSRNIAGNVILMLFYALLLAAGAKLIGDGSELLLEILNPGVIGGLVLPVLGAVPDAAIIVFSGAMGSKEDAQDQIAVGVGTLAGSTIMLLTIPWAFSLLLGRCTIKKGKMVDGECKGFHPWKQGVSVMWDVPINAWIMILTSFSYFIVQGVAFAYLGDPSGNSAKKIEKWFALAGFIVCAIFFVAYSLYQVLNVSAQERRMSHARKKALQQRVIDRMTEIMKASRERMEAAEARKQEEEEKLAAGHTHEEIEEERANTAALKMGMRWRAKAAQANESTNSSPDDNTSPDAPAPAEPQGDIEQGADIDIDADIDADENTPILKKEEIKKVEEEEIVSQIQNVEDEDDEESEYKDWSKKKIAFKATVLLTIGTLVVTIFSDPMVDVITEFGKEIHVPAFYVSFIVTPFCSNASELISSLMFAAKKKEKNMTLTYSQVYGAAIMNNTMCLGIFYALICFRGLAWTFSAETLTIFLAELLIGFIGGTRKCLRMYWFVIILCFYPLSLGFVALMENVAGWQ